MKPTACERIRAARERAAELVCPCDEDDARPDCPYHGEESWPQSFDAWRVWPHRVDLAP